MATLGPKTSMQKPRSSNLLFLLKVIMIVLLGFNLIAWSYDLIFRSSERYSLHLERLVLDLQRQIKEQTFMGQSNEVSYKVTLYDFLELKEKVQQLENHMQDLEQIIESYGSVNEKMASALGFMMSRFTEKEEQEEKSLHIIALQARNNADQIIEIKEKIEPLLDRFHNSSSKQEDHPYSQENGTHLQNEEDSTQEHQLDEKEEETVDTYTMAHVYKGEPKPKDGSLNKSFNWIEETEALITQNFGRLKEVMSHQTQETAHKLGKVLEKEASKLVRKVNELTDSVFKMMKKF